MPRGGLSMETDTNHQLPIHPGMLVAREGESSLRLLWVDPGRNLVIAIPVNEREHRTDVFSWDTISMQLVMGVATVAQDAPPPLTIRMNDLTVAERNSFKRARACVKSLMEHEPEIYFPLKRGAIIRKICEQHAVSIPTVYTALWRFLLAGKTYAALVPNFRNCGAPGSEREKDYANKLGRPRDPARGSTGRNLTQEDRALISRIIAKGTDKEIPRPNLQNLYAWLLLRHYPEALQRYNDGNRTRMRPIDQDLVPSYEQFEYAVRKRENKALRYIDRYGRKAYERLQRALLSNNLEHVKGPGARYEIDATILDVYLVSQMDRNWVVGRPTLYIVIDVFSRMIAGYYLALEPPSWRCAAMALINAVTNKVEFAARYDMHLDPEDWPVADFPGQLLTDNGELKSLLADALPEHGLCTLENAPAGRPDLKGLVESEFGIINAELGEFVPGHIDKQAPFEKRGRKYPLDAILTLYELNQFIIQRILIRNATPRSRYPAIPELVANNVAPSPWSLWNWGQETLRIESRRLDPDYVALHLLPCEEGVIERRGIRIFTDLYYDPGLLRREWWFQGIQNARGKVDVVYHPGDMTRVRVKHPHDRTRWFDCELTAASAHYRGSSLVECTALRYHHRVNARREADQRAHEILALRHDSGQILKRAAEAAKQAKNPALPDSLRLANQASQRAKEAELERRTEANHLGFDGPAGPVPSRETGDAERRRRHELEALNEINAALGKEK
jgi:hypothetical protein